MWNFIKWETLQFIGNKKNQAVYIILLLLSVYYAFAVAPTYEPVEKVSRDEMQAAYDTRAAFIESVEGRENLHPSVQFAASLFPEWNKVEKRRIDALDEGDLLTYASSTAEWYTFTNELVIQYGDYFYYNPLYYTHGNSFARDDGFYAYGYTASRYDHYSQGNHDLSYELFEERTALQTVQRLLNNFLPFVVLISCILLTADIVLKDRRNPSIVKGFPISDWKRMFGKGFVAFVGSLVTVIPLSAGLLIIGLREGFGDFLLGVPIYNTDVSIFNYRPDLEIFSTIPMWEYLVKNIAFLSLWFIALIALIILLSITLRLEFLNIAIGLGIVFAEFLYFERAVSPFTDAYWYPTSYVQVGQVISGTRDFLYASELFTAERGVLLVAGSALLCILLVLLITTNKRFSYTK
ncbi:ABC transporter permease [Chryseomicrobium sp. FSL W7-1435]|uniref:ABC transporter permease n=1 Tax=Chryseomicrobium sp. FSL W7-1435 TaxID=2921704 RepID=UPI003159D171